MKKSVEVEDPDVASDGAATALADKATRLNELHSEIEGQEQSSLKKAVDAGGIAAELKDLVGHGNWGDWIDDNLDVD